jgi:hypothetical protein
MADQMADATGAAKISKIALPPISGPPACLHAEA